ncbi:PocR ligand-binding domain-containing protein [Candidatus Albibeggiatoa sp. nov. NOAA]|uniref:PocR ligand-binding domain-containing protein n=1 Tax=Candidatus Albibeggiatoa sp. nov. NOAA TaxID=3162724 RepID=UPI003300D57C|nr:PocR ligand-binding domain-containing protein [Thiotrichaceae bacterium]
MIKTNNIFDKFFNVEVIQRLQDHFATQTGVASIISDLKGVPYTKPSNFSKLCSYIRETPKGGANCMYSDSVIGKRANRDRPHIQPCLSGGLWDAGACLHVGNIHVANWLIGQVMNGAQDLSKMMDYATQIEVDQEKFSYALTQVTIMTEEQFNHTCQALFLLANAVSECAVYEKDLSLPDMDVLLQKYKAELSVLVEQEPSLEAVWPVWDEFETAARHYELTPPLAS